MVDRAQVEGWCAAGILPSQDNFFEVMLEGSGLFTDTEGQNWDFKDSWPFSYSDSYFGGISRLICAFSNSTGGIIVFGVKDETREGGKNKVRPNIDKLLLSFKQLAGSTFEYDFKTYGDETDDRSVDVLLIKARPRSARPYVFNKKISNYEPGIIWIRSGNEVLRAQPQHYANLFLEDQNEGVEGSIPPSTAQIKKFVGRAEAMTDLFDWVQNSDEPRTYLYGKGGSGKTTIAREFSKLVKSSGHNLKIEGENNIDIVIFLSAKEKELISAESQIINIDEPDFHDETTLLAKIIHLSGGELDVESKEVAGLSDYRRTLLEYFDHFSYLIVIDDVDTLTTKGIDPGADFLYRALSRARKRSKVLYTTRNAPTQSLYNSIEVPGLFGDDYERFVDECIERFKSPKPDKEFRDTTLPKLSERRPLVIESIIALSRTSGGFKGAERLFMQNIGDDVRDYVFSREWDALSDGLERPVLAALADLNKPATFEDLKIILQAGDSTIRDAIGGVREMFLTVDDAGDDALYSLAPLTRSFVNSRKQSLRIYQAVKVRTQSFKKSIKTTTPEVVRIISKVRNLVPLRFSHHADESLRSAHAVVFDHSLAERVTEDPVFRALRGYVAAIQKRPDMPGVRDDFLYSIHMKHEPEIEELMAWYNAEKNSQTLESHLFAIADTVLSGRKYTEDDKVGMISRKATTSYNLARQRVYSDPENALKGFRESLLLHLRAFKLNAITGSPMLNISEKYARNTSDQWIRMLSEYGRWEPIFSTIALEKECDGYLDPISSPFISYLERISCVSLVPEERSRLLAQIKRRISEGFDSSKWMDTTILPRIERSLASLQTQLQAQKQRKGQDSLILKARI